MRWTGRALVVLLLALAAGVGLAPRLAAAHATLARSDPADGAELAQPPRQVRLWFTEAISLDLSAFGVVDVDGRTVPVRATSPTAGAATLVQLGLPALRQGVYTVSWWVLSENDAHTTRGLIVFGVGTAAVPAGNAADTAARAPVAPLEVAIRWLDLCLLAGLMGAFAVGRIVLSPAGGESRRRQAVRRAATRRVLGLAACAGFLALATGLLQLLVQAGHVTRLAGSPWDLPWWGAGGEILLGTRWGALWLVRQGIVLALALLALGLWRRARAAGGVPVTTPTVAGALIVVLAVTKALSGHAAALGSGAGLAVAADALHLLAAAAWVGGLMALAFGLAPLVRDSAGELAAEARACLRSFSALAALSVGILVTTGLYSAGRLVASPDALLVTPYGQALLAKTGLVAEVAVLGLVNAAILNPRVAGLLGRVLRRPPGWTPLAPSRLPAVVAVEASVGLMVLLMAGVMGSAPPASGPQFAPAAGPAADSLTMRADDVLVTLTVKPNRPGTNVFLVSAASSRRPPPAQITGVTLRLTPSGQGWLPAAVPMQRVEPGRYRAGGGQLDLAGAWRIDVLVHRTGMRDSAAAFSWTVPAAPAARRVVLSDRPLEPVLSLAALLVGALVLAMAALAWGRSLPRPPLHGSPVPAPRVRREV